MVLASRRDCRSVVFRDRPPTFGSRCITILPIRHACRAYANWKNTVLSGAGRILEHHARSALGTLHFGRGLSPNGLQRYFIHGAGPRHAPTAYISLEGGSRSATQRRLIFLYRRRLNCCKSHLVGQEKKPNRQDLSQGLRGFAPRLYSTQNRPKPVRRPCLTRSHPMPAPTLILHGPRRR